jgi:hypothetical protein
MTPATVRVHAVTPGALAEVLAGDKVLIAARNLLEARCRWQAAARSSNDDRAGNGESRQTAMFLAARDARVALEELADAADRAAHRLAREAIEG